jgi:hypothetical protein
MEPVPLQIRVNTVADPGPIQAYDQALRGLNQTAKDTAATGADVESSTKGTTTGLRQATMAGREFHLIMHGITEAGQGGARSIYGVTTAVRGLLMALRMSIGGAGIFGAVAIALGVLGGLFMALKGHGESAAKGVDAAKAAADKAKEALQKLEKEALEAVNYQMEQISVNARNAAAELDNLRAASNKLAEAEIKNTLSKIRADDTLSAAQKEHREFVVTAAGEQKKFEAEQSDRETKLAQKRKENLDAAHVVQDAVREQRNVEDELRNRKQDRDTLKDELERVQEDIAQAKAFATPGGEGPEEAARRRKMEDRERDLKERQAKNDEDIKDLTDRQEVAKKVVDAASEDAAKKEAANKEDIAKLGDERQIAAEKEAFQDEQEAKRRDFATKQKEEAKKLKDEDAKLAKEAEEQRAKAEAAEVETNKGPGDPAAAAKARARMDEIATRRAAISKDLGERTAPVTNQEIAAEVRAQTDATAAMKGLSGEIHALTDAVKSAPTLGSGGTITKGGKTVAVGEGAAEAPPPGGTITPAGGAPIAVGAGDAHAVADALKGAADAHAATNATVIAFAKDSVKNDQQLGSQLTSMREVNPPPQ